MLPEHRPSLNKFGRQAASRRQKVKSQEDIYSFSTLSTRRFSLFKHMYLLWFVQFVVLKTAPQGHLAANYLLDIKKPRCSFLWSCWIKCEGAVPVHESVSRSVWFHLVRTAARFVKYSPSEIPSEQDFFENCTSATSSLLNKQAPIVKKCVCTQKHLNLFGADFQGRTCQNIKDLVPSNNIF